MIYAGGCLCGSLRYSASEDPSAVGYCHCRMCQKLSGATMLPWASFATAAFAYVDGAPKVFRSSTSGTREFCADCGSQILYRSLSNTSTVEINVGTLDDPAAVQPQYHIWCESRVAWFDSADELPSYQRAESPS